MHRHEHHPQDTPRLAEFLIDRLFVQAVISEDMRRGVRYYALDGTPLLCLDDVLYKLWEEGEFQTTTDHANLLVSH